MSRALIVATLLALVGCAHAPPEPAPAHGADVISTAPAKPAAPKEEPISWRPLATPTPMQLVTQPNPAQPIVSIRLVFHSGSIDDPAGKEGLTALTARVLNEGGTQELTAAQLIQALFPMAAELSSQVDKEMTVFQGRVHKDKVDMFLKLFMDTLLSPRLDPKEVERLKADQLSSIRNGLRGEDDEQLGKVGLDALLYPNHPYGHFVNGTVKGLSSVTAEDVRAQAKAIFTQDRLVIGLAGPIDDALIQEVKQRLAALPPTGAPAVKLPAAEGAHGRVWVMKKDAISTAISMGFSVSVRRGDPDFFALALAASYLGEHRQFTGLMMQELRDKRGLNYGDYSYAEHFLQESEGTFALPNIARSQQDFSIWLRPVEPQNAIFATRGALYYLQQLAEKGPDPEHFETVRGFLAGYTRLWEQTDQRRLGYAIDDVFYGTHELLSKYREAIAQLTPEQVREAVARHWKVDHLNAVYVAQDAQALADALKKGAPSPIVYPTPKAPAVLEVDKTIEHQPLPFSPDAIEVREASRFMEQ